MKVILDHNKTWPTVLNVEEIEGRDLEDSDIVRLQGFHGVRLLSLAGCDKLTDDGVSSLCAMAHFEMLDLSLCNQLTDHSIVAIAECSSLQRLNLTGCYAITDLSLKALGLSRSLTSLILAHCSDITDLGMTYLAASQTLATLDLPDFSSISDIGLAELAKTKSPLVELCAVYLDRITIDGLSHLLQIATLRKLTIRDCALITLKDIELLRSSHRTCEFDYSSSVGS